MPRQKVKKKISKLADIECFQSKYIYKTGKKCRHTLKKNSKGEFLFPIVFSINSSNGKSSDFEELVNEKLVSSFQKCNMAKCNEYYRYEFKHSREFLFFILDYLNKDLNNSNSIKVKEKLIKYNISCFSEFYEIIGFIIMPKINHFTSILICNINDNNEYEYYCYDILEER